MYKKNGKRLFFTVVIILIMLRGIAMAEENVVKEVLDNGVTVIIKENHTAPVAAANFWVKVGSAYESDDEKGITHFIEHLLFKGTEKRGLGQIDREIKELGGYNNAFTSYDATNYVIVLPSEHINKAIEIEFDALTNSVFDADELEKEREVVLAEYQRGEDNPHNVLWKTLMKKVFRKHYKDPIIGFEKTIKGFSRDKVISFYKKYYVPQNLIVVISGDVNSKKVMEYIKSTFGNMKQQGWGTGDADVKFKPGRKLSFDSFSGPIQSRYFAIAYKIPDALWEDVPRLEILARIMGGSESSVLYRNIKEKKGLVDDIDADIFAGKFGGVFVVSGTVRRGEFREVLKEIFKEIEKIKIDGVSASEISKVKSDILREEAKESMKVENMAMNLGYYEMLGDYELYDEYYSLLKRTIDTDIQDVAARYLVNENITAVVHYPEKSKAEFKGIDSDAVLKIAEKAVAKDMKDPSGVVKTTLDNGATLIYKKLENTPIVSAKFMFKGGIVYESAQEGYYRGITNLMMETMLKGTKTRDAEEIAEEIDMMGGIIGKDIKKDSFGWGLEVMNKNFDPLMELFSDVLRNPVFKLGEIKKEKTDIKNMIKRRKDNPAGYAVKLFNELLFEWHPYGYPIAGEIESIDRTPSTMIKTWHRNYVRPNNLIITVVGNIGYDKVKTILNRRFAGWEPGKDLNPNLPVKITKQKKTKRETIDKNQSHVVIGFLGPKTSGGDYFAFRVLDTILSGGMNSRLFTEIRDHQNLCYTIYSTFDRYVEKGAFRIYTATDPKNEEKVEVEIMKILKEMYDNGVTEKEVETAKNYINGMYKIGFQDYSAQADAYCSYEMLGLGYKKVDEFMDEIMKVTKSDVDKMIKKYFELKNYTKVVVGP